jgi:hypothetical protein
MIKSRRMRWAVHVAHMGAMINLYKILATDFNRRDSFDYTGVDDRIILIWI